MATLLVLSLVTLVLLTACGDGREIPESERKAFFTEFREQGLAADAEVTAMHPDDEDKKMEAFRERVQQIRGKLREKYGIGNEEVEKILAEAHAKNW